MREEEGGEAVEDGTVVCRMWQNERRRRRKKKKKRKEKDDGWRKAIMALPGIDNRRALAEPQFELDGLPRRGKRDDDMDRHRESQREEDDEEGEEDEWQ